MQLASVPAPLIDANRQVLSSLQSAAALTRQSQAALELDGIGAVSPAELNRALGHAQDAARGVELLGRGIVLDGTFQRYTRHSVRELREAVAMLERPGELGPDGVTIFAKRLFDAEVSTRLGSEAGDRSMARPVVRERASSSASDGASGGSGSGPAWVDGEWLDSLGNPARGGDAWAGPDGERYGSDGSAADDSGSWTGPDGESFSGI